MDRSLACYVSVYVLDPCKCGTGHHIASYGTVPSEHVEGTFSRIVWLHPAPGSRRRGKLDEERSSVGNVRNGVVGKARSLTPWTVALAYVLRGVDSLDPKAYCVEHTPIPLC